MNYSRRLLWLLLGIYIILVLITMLKKNVSIAQTTKEANDNHTTPIVFLEEHMADKNKDIIEYMDDLNRARKELNSILELEHEVAIKREQAKLEQVQAEKEKDYQDVTLTISFYTALESENGKGRANMNAIGGELTPNQSIAMPRDIPFGSILEIEGYGERVCDDRGSKKYIKWLNDDKTHMKVDLYIAPKKGESNKQYWERVNNMGVIKGVKAKLYIKGE